jgi:hypothetical protein
MTLQLISVQLANVPRSELAKGMALTRTQQTLREARTPTIILLNGLEGFDPFEC